ncbi:MAG: hypothetical protein Q9211_000422 [Gyalolechia sp. 1 TL-2023]
MVKVGNDQVSSYDEAFYSGELDQQLDPQLATLVSHETVSRVWHFESRQATQLRRCLLKPSVLENICNSTHCRLVLAEDTSAVTVKGDNDQDLDKAIVELDKLGKALPAPPLHNETFSNLMSSSDLASGFVEQWVEQTSGAKNNPFEPRRDSEEPFHLKVPIPDAMEAIEGENFGSQQAKKRYTRSRKVPGGQSLDNTNHSESLSLGHQAGTDLIPIDEGPVSNPLALTSAYNLVDEGPFPTPPELTNLQNLIDVSSDENPLPCAIATCSSSGTRSHGASQKSTLLQVRSGTPSTHVSAHPKDLLAGQEESINYPVMDQAPSIHGPSMPPDSSQASAASDFQSNSGTPRWLKQNPTSRASNEMKGLRLIAADGDRRPAMPQSSYLEAAKRGAVRARGVQRGRAGPRGRVYRGMAPTFSERLQSSSEVQSRQVFRTMHQKMAKPSIGQAGLLKGIESATAQLLQSVRAFEGVVKLEVEIGRIFVKGESNAMGRTFSFSEWSSVFATQAENKVETIFSKSLPVSDTNIRYLTDLKQSNGRRIFAESPHDNTLKYHFLWAINWHFPKRQWDARLAVEIAEQTRDYQDSVDTVANTLSIVPSADQRTANIFAEIGNSDLIFKSASIIRQIQFACLMDPDIIMSCSEIQYLGPAKERHRYYNSHKDVGAAKRNGDLWWEVRLRSTSMDDHLQQNRHLRFGDQVGWRAEEIVQGGVVEQLHGLATEIVTQMDGIEAPINRQAQRASMNDNDSKEDTATQPSFFW